MIRLREALSVLTICACVTAAAGQQHEWVRTNGPYRTDIHSLAVDGDGTLYAHVKGGLFRSEDGAHWTRAAYPDDDGGHLTTQGRTLYAWDRLYLHRSEDRGETWEKLDRPTMSLQALVADGDSLYASFGTSRDGTVFRSDDRGQSWTPIGLLPPDPGTALLLVWGDTILIGRGNSIYRTRDAGVSWAESNQGLPNARLAVPRQLHHHEEAIFLGLNDFGVYRSLDRGDTWHPTGLLDVDVLALDSMGDVVFAAIQGSGLLRSSDLGESWTHVDDGINDPAAVIAIDDVEGRLLAGGVGLHVSDDGGNSWRLTALGALYSSGMYRSFDSGDTWERLGNESPVPRRPRALGSYEGGLYISQHGSVLRSLDGGDTWESVHEGVMAGNLSVFVTFDGRLYAGGETEVLRWDEQAHAWLDASDGIPRVERERDRAFTHRVYSTAVFADSLYVGSGGHGVYRLDEVGGTWQPNGLQGRKVYALHADGSALYAGTDYGLFKATSSDVRAVEPGTDALTAWGEIKRNELLPNYPNPFNPETWIPYRLAKATDVTVRIHGPTGQVVRTLDLARQPAGDHVSTQDAAHWDGRNDVGEQVASGVYFVRLDAGNFSGTRRMAVLK